MLKRYAARWAQPRIPPADTGRLLRHRLLLRGKGHLVDGGSAGSRQARHNPDLYRPRGRGSGGGLSPARQPKAQRGHSHPALPPSPVRPHGSSTESTRIPDRRRLPSLSGSMLLPRGTTMKRSIALLVVGTALALLAGGPTFTVSVDFSDDQKQVEGRALPPLPQTSETQRALEQVENVDHSPSTALGKAVGVKRRG